MRQDPFDATFAALADPTRRAILARLAKGEATVNELAAPFDMTQPSISKHLSVLHDAGLVHQQKRGQHIIYSIAADNLANSLYSFLTPFCPDARKISAERKKARGHRRGDE